MTPIAIQVERVVVAIGRLVTQAEAVEDEWIYVHDLEAVWVARLRTVAGSIGAEPGSGVDAAAVSPRELEAAIGRLVDEVDAITDPHRAIDWLSTLPQATLVALGADAW